MHFEHSLDLTLKILGVIALALFVIVWFIFLIGAIIGVASTAGK